MVHSSPRPLRDWPLRRDSPKSLEGTAARLLLTAGAGASTVLHSSLWPVPHGQKHDASSALKCVGIRAGLAPARYWLHTLYHISSSARNTSRPACCSSGQPAGLALRRILMHSCNIDSRSRYSFRIVNMLYHRARVILSNATAKTVGCE